MQNSMHNFCVGQGKPHTHTHTHTHTCVCTDYLLLFAKGDSGQINQKLIKITGEEAHNGGHRWRQNSSEHVLL